MADVYGYIRVSTREQNEERQMLALREVGVLPQNICMDKQSGRDFNRPQYKKLVRRLKKGDLLYIKSIDRLGRNYQAILEEWADLTKRLEVQIVVLDMPLLDTRSRPDNLVGCFISDLVLQILSFVAENERINIKTRQAEGIRIAKEKGKHLGRPRYIPPENFSVVAACYLRHECTLQQALDQLQIKKSTFYKYIRNLDAV